MWKRSGKHSLILFHKENSSEMKKHLFTIALMSLFMVGHAQALLEVPDKRSTTVVITLPSTTAADAYRLCANVLQDEGWQLEKTDAVLYTMSTNWKKIKGFIVRDWEASASIREGQGGAVEVHLRARIRQDVKNINQGFGIVSAENYDYSPLEKRTNMGKDWEELMKVAGLIGSHFGYK